MLHVWTSPPSKVPAYSMSAPVVVNRHRASAGSIFTAGSLLHSGFGAKERAAIAYVAVGDIWGLDDQVWGVEPHIRLPSSCVGHIAACVFHCRHRRARAAVRPTLSPPSMVITGAKSHLATE